eukprot:scaffold173_cov88-Cylindrotheca_fusiformis.AAC.3
MGDATTGDVIHSDEATKTKRGSAPRGIIVIEGNELGNDGISIRPTQLTSRITLRVLSPR